jgi:hypothetical protein
MIKLKELIKLAGVELGDFKIHCATGSNPIPLEAFFDGHFEEWQGVQRGKNFECENILALIHLQKNQWLFAGVYRVDGVKKRKSLNRYWYRYVTTTRRGSWQHYSTTEVKGLDHLTGRAIIHFERKFRASYLRDPKFLEQLVVTSILEQRMTIGDFPGYNSVLLSYHMLKTLVRENNPSWRAALSNVAGVYLITDTTSGKLYVGSAYGGKGIWQRWLDYAKNGHGGNKELRALLGKKGAKHASLFQFSLLEVCDLNSSEEDVIGRESHWKNVLLSREFGLNKN